MRNNFIHGISAAIISITSMAYAEEVKIPFYSLPSEGISQIFNRSKATTFTNIDTVTRGGSANVFQRAVPSVVKILTNDGSGTGVILSSDGNGLIITNNHVIKDYETVGVVFSSDADSENVTLATVIKIDEVSDLALLSLNEQRSDLVPIEVSDKALKIGEDVHAIGHPFDEDWTYTRGYISQLRTGYSWSPGPNEHHVANIIQTQTPINPGNSGGPLLDDDAKLVGINTFVNTKAQGLNYSIAWSTVEGFLKATDSRYKKTMSENSPFFGTLLQSFDVNKNGLADRYMYDSSLNNIWDILVEDTDEDLIADKINYDENENEIIEMQVFFDVYEGKNITVYLFDEDEDGSFETMGIDGDQDGVIDYVGPNS